MADSQRPRILLIDDEPLIGALIVRLLAAGYDVTVVTHGQAALDLLDASDDFRLILCDLMMPGLSGMDVHAALEARGSPLVQTMVFLTGGAFASQEGDFLERVPNLCLEKPFLADELRIAVREGVAKFKA